MNATYREEDWIGRKAERRVVITGEMLDRFVQLSGDCSPIHLSDAVAQQRGFSRRVVHGMMLGSLVSAVIGNDLPGDGGVLHEMQLAFRKPCHPEDEITIEVEVCEYFESVQTLVLKIKITRTDGDTLATGIAAIRCQEA